MKKSTLKCWFCEILESILPNRTKRLIVLTSLCAKIINRLRIDHEYLSLLNTQLTLCREEESLKLPLLISDAIWNEHLPPEVLSGCLFKDEEIHSLANKIVDQIPEWLRYDRPSFMMDDLSSLLKFNATFIQTHSGNHAIAH